MTRSEERGSALVMTVIVVLVITVIGVGVINFASREVAGAYAGARRQALVACAESARQLLVSKFHAVGLTPTSIQALNVPLDTTSTSSAKTLAVGGHVDDTSVQVNQVVFLPETAFGPTSRIRDITNIVSVTGQGGRPLRVVVHCVDHGDGTATGGRQLEIEFGVRFGL
jgi:hypothetical protein